MSDSTIRILVADDHPIVLDGLVAILSTQPDFQVVAQATSGQDAVDRFRAVQPDVVLLDLEMPDVDGVEALRRIRAQDPQARAIAFTAFDTDERILEAVKAGVQGYLLKGAPREEIFNAVRVVHQGQSLLQPVVAGKLMRQFRADPAPQPEPLTEREQDVLHLLCQGLQNKEIGRELSITERTVKFHVSAILAKLCAGKRTEAVAIATQQGLISDERD